MSTIRATAMRLVHLVRRGRRHARARSAYRGMFTAVCALLAGTNEARAQCVSDLRNEIRGLTAIADGVLRRAGGSDTSTISRDSAEAALRDASIFNGRAVTAGPATACLLLRQTQYQQAAIAALPDTAKKRVSRDELRQAVAEGITAALAGRYQATDRMSLIVGIAVTVGFDKRAVEQWKVVSRTDTVTAGGTQQAREQRFIARESGSRSFPSATTGVLVRAWTPQVGWRLLPSGAFGAIQISGTGGAGPVSGASLGLSWDIIPAAQILLGYSTTRNRTLRSDLRAQYVKDTLLPLPAGETQETILGTRSTNGLLIALALPVSLSPSLGLR